MASNDTNSNFSARSNEFGKASTNIGNKFRSDETQGTTSASRRSWSDTTAASNIDSELSQKKRMKRKIPPTSNDDYSRHLAMLHDIRDILQSRDILHLPQIIVVGSQSDGKSSLLSCLTGVDFPEKSGICTKAPIVVRCKHDASRNCDQYIIRDPMDNEYVECRDVEVANRISDIQENVLRGRDLIVSEDEISICVSGPAHMDIIIIDLPGIVTNGEGQEETKRLIRKYGRHEETLILLVTKAETDSQLLPALDLAKEINPSGDRTLRVFTKFDQFGSPDVKRRALELMHSGGGWALDPHAVVCRSKRDGNMEYIAEMEMQILQECNLPLRLAGVSALKLRLPTLFSRLVDHNFPKLWEQASLMKEAAKSRLDTIGWEPVDPKEKVMACRDKLVQCTAKFEAKITTAFLAFQLEIRATEARVTKEFTDANYESNCFRIEFFHGPEAVDESIKQIVTWWKDITMEYVGAVENVLSKELQYLEDGDIGPVSQTLLDFLGEKWQQCYRGYCASFRKNCILALDKEKLSATMSHNAFSEDLRHIRDMKLDKQQTHLVFIAVKSIFARKIETFINNIMQETQYTILSGRHSFSDTELMRLLPGIHEKAVDCSEILHERAKLMDKVRCMEQVEEKLKSM